MMVGSTLKAKKAPVLATNPAVVSRPAGPGTPTGTFDCTRLPKTNRAPCSWKPSSPVMARPMALKTTFPGPVLRTMTPKSAWSASPEPTRRQSIFFRS